MGLFALSINKTNSGSKIKSRGSSGNRAILSHEKVKSTRGDVSNGTSVAPIEHSLQVHLLVHLEANGEVARSSNGVRDEVAQDNKAVSVVQVVLRTEVVS